MLSYILISIILVLAELSYFRIADYFNIIDKPNLRSSHKHITLRGGGIIFLFGAWLWGAFFGIDYPWFLTGVALIAIVSFLDDIKSVPNWIRLTVQFTSMFLMFHELGILQLNMWWLALAASIVCVGITNAYNFMDGINGITGGYSIGVLIPLIAVNTLPRQGLTGFINQDLLLVLLLSVLIFCFFNFRKEAKCFAGDVGAVTMAFILVFAIGKLILKTGDFSYIMFLAVYGVDSVLTIIHRLLLHENLGKAHRKHAYQLMANELNMPHTTVSSIYMILQLAISAGLFFIPINHYVYSAIVLFTLAIVYIIFMKKNYHLHESFLQSNK